MIPLVSVVVPAYNAEARIDSTLKSIIAQDYKNIEIILVDDSSTDATLAVSKKALAEGGRPWRIAEHAGNKGVSAARNTGLDASNGEYVLFFDADDLADKNFVSVLYETISKYGSDLAFCGFRTSDELYGVEKAYPVALDLARRYTPEDFTVMRIFSEVAPSICSFLFRVDFLRSNGLAFTEGCIAGEDVEFVIKSLSVCERARFSALCPYIYVKHPGMGSIAGCGTEEQFIRRYIDNTNAHFRTANFLIERSRYAKAVDAARNYLLPASHIRLLTIYARTGDFEGFKKTIGSSEVRNALRASYKYFFKKPDVYLKALCLLCLPNLYYRLRAMA
ncbi:MAG: glycosyltransferase [Synergistaceae bacterium]|nr:glycosyltransferase [Synergistaceae bacterium]